ncbi:MAG: hypothetical protein JNG88_07245 [Phycisphaerales bacterium]|nr:hypothetical protein [Phycisphaerales bacterium]
MNRHLRRAAAKTYVLAGVVVLVGGLAAWRLFTKGSSIEDAAPDDADSAVAFVCEGCNQQFDMTLRQIDDAQRRNDYDSDAQTRMMKYRCPKCNERKGVRGKRCPAHGDVVKLAPGPNDPRKCSKCDFPKGQAP